MLVILAFVTRYVNAGPVQDQQPACGSPQASQIHFHTIINDAEADNTLYYRRLLPLIAPAERPDVPCAMGAILQSATGNIGVVRQWQGDC